MIKRVFLQGVIGFEDGIELYPNAGLTVFTGPSGAGKSVLLEAVMSPFALKEPTAMLAEATLDALPTSDESGIELGAEPTLKVVKKDKIRYFADGQAMSKKAAYALSHGAIRHIANQDDDELAAKNLLYILDAIAQKNFPTYTKTLQEYAQAFEQYAKTSAQLSALGQNESLHEEQKEFLKFEIDKLQAAKLEDGEQEKLEELKKSFSDRQKIQTALEKTSSVVSSREKVSTLCALLGRDSAFCGDFFEQLQDLAADAEARLLQLDEIDIDVLMNRLEEIWGFKKRYGSIALALEALAEKQSQLSRLQNASFDKEQLQKELLKLDVSLDGLCEKLTVQRKKASKQLVVSMNEWLLQLGLKECDIGLAQTKRTAQGRDEAALKVGGVLAYKLSSGEQRRCRLALLTAALDSDETSVATLFLDEIDANLSGKESAGVAKLLAKLSGSYQIFAISHQPQLTAVADAHYLVYKENGQGKVCALNDEQRVKEIARIISGDNIAAEAVSFAQKLLTEGKKC